MAVGLFIAATAVVTTYVLVCGLIKLKKSERARTKKLFERETGKIKTFDTLRKTGWTGFTEYYLNKKFDYGNLTTTASLGIVFDLVKLDLAEGTKPEEIVFGCCNYWPNRDVISAVIEKTGAKIKDVLEYENKNGTKCLIIMFNVLDKQKNTRGKKPAGTEMATEVEKSVQYLIELGEKQRLEMKPISEKSDKSGQTLFESATFYSPNLALQLLNKGINAKSIDYKFMTPQFKFKSLHRPMIAAGVNPYVLDYKNGNQVDRYSVSKELVSKLNPALTFDLYFSTISLPCNDTCNVSCRQGLPNPWYYNNGLIYDFKREDRIGDGAEGAVFSGDFHGRDAAFKFVEIKNLKRNKMVSDAINDLTNRLSEMTKNSETNGQNVLPFYGHIRQQFSAEKMKDLGLGIEVTRFEVYITKQCDYNLAHLKYKIGINIEEAKNIIDQLINAQEQLQAAGVSHNDIKPGNILVDNDSQFGYKVFVGDFGQADQLGGTPGWTPPEFIDPRVPGVSDMYSFGLVFLYILCEDDETFFSIRDNFIDDKDVNQQWFLDIIDLPVMKLVQRMTEPDHKNRMKLAELKLTWKKIRSLVGMISPGKIGFQKSTGRDSVTKLQNILGRNLTLTESRNTFTRTHLQGDSTLCWLYSITSSLHQSMKLKAEKRFETPLYFESDQIDTREGIFFLPDPTKAAAKKFLRKEHFHQNLRNEILFGLLPKSLEKGADQRNSIPHLIDTLQCRGYLRKERGLKRLPTIRRFLKLIEKIHKSSYQVHTMRMDDFVYKNLNEKPLVIVNGHDKTQKSSFGHAVVLTKCVLNGTKIEFELKNSLEGAHLKGTVDLAQITSDQEIHLTQIKNPNPNFNWTINCYLTLFVTF